MRVLVPLPFVCALLLLPTDARAALRIKWDCYLPNASVDCVTLEHSLTSKIPFLLVVDDAKSADVVVTLTSVPAEDGTRFKLDFVGPRETSVHTTDTIPRTIDAATATVRIMTKLERGLDDFMDQSVAGEVKDGKLTIEVSDPVALPFQGRPQQAIRWYVAPGVGGYLSDVVGVGVNVSGNASLAVNYSGPRWRLQQAIGASYSQQSQPVAGTSESATVSFAAVTVTNVLSWSVPADRRWSVAALAGAEKTPQANYTMRANVSVGLELDLVPRQTVNQKNLGFRCAIGPEMQRYDATNIEGLDQQVIARELCDVFVAWHFAPIDVGASLGETVVLKSPDYRSFSWSLSATWRVTDNLVISPWVSIQQIRKAINEAAPSSAVYADPKEEVEASMRAAVQQGYTAPFGVQSGLTVRYLFGNGSLASEDQRWKGATNLR